MHEQKSPCVSIVSIFLEAVSILSIPFDYPNLYMFVLFRFAQKMGMDGWKCSNGFIHRFKKHYNFVSKKLCGEGGAAPDVSDFIRDKLIPTISRYRPRDIYNCDETGLLYRSPPTTTIATKGKSVHGGKFDHKKRLTLFLFVNMDGSDKCKPIVIGESKKPRCFKNIAREDLSCDYYNNSTSWMNSDFFMRIVQEFDRRMYRQKRKVLLTLDNASCHPNIKLSNVELLYFPPNATSVIQPLDQGILRSVKARYKRVLCHKYLAAIEKKEDARKVLSYLTVKEAMDIVRDCWDQTPARCILNCFRHAGFKHPAYDASTCSDDEEDEIPDPAPEPAVWARINERLQVDVNFDDYVRADDGLNVREELTDAEIAESVNASYEKKDAEEGKNDEEDPDESISIEPIKNTSEFLQMLERQKLFLQSHHLPINSLKVVEKQVITIQVDNCRKQASITKFLQPVSDLGPLVTPPKAKHKFGDTVNIDLVETLDDGEDLEELELFDKFDDPLDDDPLDITLTNEPGSPQSVSSSPPEPPPLKRTSTPLTQKPKSQVKLFASSPGNKGKSTPIMQQKAKQQANLHVQEQSSGKGKVPSNSSQGGSGALIPRQRETSVFPGPNGVQKVNSKVYGKKTVQADACIPSTCKSTSKATEQPKPLPAKAGTSTDGLSAREIRKTHPKKQLRGKELMQAMDSTWSSLTAGSEFESEEDW